MRKRKKENERVNASSITALRLCKQPINVDRKQWYIVLYNVFSILLTNYSKFTPCVIQGIAERQGTS